MALHPEAAALLDRLAALDAPPLSAGTPVEARRGYDAAPKPEGDPLPEVRDLEIPGPGERPLHVRVYRPTEGTAPGAIAFFHGGGWVLSSIDGHDSLARRIAARSGAVVVSVEYRLAPEHPYPAPHDDCWAATRWVADHLDELGVQPGPSDQRVAIAGDSAGGNLAAGVALRARDEGLGLAFQLLIYPCIDDRLDTPSAADNGEGYFLSSTDMAWFWDQFVPADHRNDPYAVPMRATDLAGLAPALIQTAGYDPLRDEGAAWGDRLRDAGVPVTVTDYPGMIHGFVARWDSLPSAVDAHDEFGAALRAAFAADPARSTT